MKYCPDSPKDLGFTVDSWWTGQQESIDLILTEFINNGKKYVMLGAPTGCGKTLIASAVQRLLAKHALGRASLVLTHTIGLQKQYQKTLVDAAVVTGRGNHLCELSEDSDYRIGTDSKNPLTAEDAPCVEGPCPEDMKGPGGCGYYRQWWIAARSPMTIMNYAYAARVLQQPYYKDGETTIPNPFRRDLLVADECHLAHDALVQAANLTLWGGSLARANIQIPSLVTRVETTEGGPRSQKTVLRESVPVWIDWATAQLQPLRRQVGDLAQQFDSLARSKARGAVEARTRLKRAQSLLDSLTALSKIANPNEWIIRRDLTFDKKIRSITIEPLWGWSVAGDMVFKHFQRVLLMSATPGTPELERIKLGLPKDEFVYIERPSTFKRENRPVYFWPIAKLSYTSTDADWERIAKAIGWIATRPEHLQRKGLVHSGSKANADRLVKLLDRYLGGRRAFSHGDGHSHSRESALEEFTTSDEPRILVTASFTTGLDLPYIIGWQVIAKVPFASLGDEITARRKAFKLNGYDFGAKAYTADTANTVVQAAGRIVRAPDDTGPTYILDGNWEIVKQQAYLPAWFLDAYQVFRVE